MDVSVNDKGDVYVTGTREVGSRDENFATQITMDDSDVFVRKYDSDGNEFWTQHLGTQELEDRPKIVTSDSSGNAYVMGRTGGIISGDRNHGRTDVFAAGYDSEGDRLWIRQFGTLDLDYISDAVVDGSGAIYIVGASFFRSIGPERSNGFVAKLEIPNP
jgi:hypothetical protein